MQRYLRASDQRIRSCFESRGPVLQNRAKLHTDSLTIRGSSPALATS